MDHEENRTESYGPNSYPAFFVIGRIVTLRKGKRVVEDENGSFKADIVLAEILPVLVFIPLETHAQPSLTT
jgi:hypothetical protein